jgi:hypothetical protein
MTTEDPSYGDEPFVYAVDFEHRWVVSRYIYMDAMEEPKQQYQQEQAAERQL